MSSSALRPLPRFRSLRLLSAAACLLAAAACSSGGSPYAVAVPSPSPDVATLCRALHAALPAKVDGQSRHTAQPASDLTAAWGDPAIALRCGVPQPTVLTPGTPHYDPTADAAQIDGVDWLPQKQSDGSVRCTTTLRKAYVEVTIPEKYAGPYGDMSALTDLANAISRTVPTGV
ncbi:DUF3515 domain-containing protein [Streptantibioticus parmotrematis]|uniref:DUF3515 domain-containing protein n=1 Tax=Streptantibioticus parmotrematis TaxID=2873249 RepID=UPI0033E2817F